MIYIKFFYCLGACKCFVAIICWHERHGDLLHGMYSPLVAFCLNFTSFWLSLIVFVPMICLYDIFLRKAMTGDEEFKLLL